MAFDWLLFLSILQIEFLVQQCLLLQIRKSSCFNGQRCNGSRDWQAGGRGAVVPCFSLISLRPLNFSFFLSSHWHGFKGHCSFSVFAHRSNVSLMLLLLVPLCFTCTHFPNCVGEIFFLRVTLFMLHFNLWSPLFFFTVS